MATISSPGLGSGLDVKSIVSQLVEIERTPIKTLNTRTEVLNAKLSAFGLVQSYITNLQDATNILARPATWKQTTAASADPGAVSVTSSTTAVPGSYAVAVSKLAQSQSLITPAYTTSLAPVGSGTLRIELGTWDGPIDPTTQVQTVTGFTPKTGATGIDITILPGQDTLEAVRSSINAANAGVTASIVRDASGARLAIRSASTGLENQVRITATADAPAAPGGPTLAGLVYDPPAAGAVTETLRASDAVATVNGLQITSPRNTLTDVVEGLTITLNQVTTGPTQLTVNNDTAAMRKAVDDFTKAYNDINKYIAEQTKYDPDSKTAATLQGDRSTLSLQSQLRAVVGSLSQASTRYGRLSDLGLQVQADGGLKVDDTKFGSATSAANLAETALAFSKDAEAAGSDGFAVKIRTLTTQLSSAEGLVSTRSEGLKASIARNAKQVTREEERVKNVEARLNRQYSALDTSLNRLNGLSSYVTQQIANWNKSTN